MLPVVFMEACAGPEMLRASATPRFSIFFSKPGNNGFGKNGLAEFPVGCFHVFELLPGFGHKIFLVFPDDCSAQAGSNAVPGVAVELVKPIPGKGVVQPFRLDFFGSQVLQTVKRRRHHGVFVDRQCAALFARPASRPILFENHPCRAM